MICDPFGTATSAADPAPAWRDPHRSDADLHPAPGHRPPRPGPLAGTGCHGWVARPPGHGGGAGGSPWLGVRRSPVLFGQVFLGGDNFLQNFPLRVLVGRDLAPRHRCRCGTPTCSGGRRCSGVQRRRRLPGHLADRPCSPSSTAWTLNLALVYDVALAGMYLFLRRQPVVAHGRHLRGGDLRLLRLHERPDRAHRPHRGGGLAALDAGGRPRPHRPRHRPVAAGWAGGAGVGGRVVLLALSLGLTLLAGGPRRSSTAWSWSSIYGVWTADRPPGPRHGRSAGPRPLRGRRGRRAWSAAWPWGRPSGSPGSPSSPSRNGPPPPTPSSPAARCRPGCSPWSPRRSPSGPTRPDPAPTSGTYNFPEVTSYVGILALIAAFSLPRAAGGPGPRPASGGSGT